MSDKIIPGYFLPLDVCTGGLKQTALFDTRVKKWRSVD